MEGFLFLIWIIAGAAAIIIIFMAASKPISKEIKILNKEIKNFTDSEKKAKISRMKDEYSYSIKIHAREIKLLKGYSNKISTWDAISRASFLDLLNNVDNAVKECTNYGEKLVHVGVSLSSLGSNVFKANKKNFKKFLSTLSKKDDELKKIIERSTSF